MTQCRVANVLLNKQAFTKQSIYNDKNSFIENLWQFSQHINNYVAVYFGTVLVGYIIKVKCQMYFCLV